MADPILDIRNISKSFGALKASDDVSLTLNPGEIHALIGPNGAGKSTLIAQISGALKPDSGQVLFAGEDITAMPQPARARMGLARTFQVSAIAPEFTVLQNTVLGAIGASRRPFRLFTRAMKDPVLQQTAQTALERVGLFDRSEARASDISHGERRQLEVAIALTLTPRAFLMDEPMAGLGAGGSARLTGFLQELKAEAPILLVEHDMDAVFALADRISVLVYGRVIAQGTPAEIRANKDVRDAYLGDAA